MLTWSGPSVCPWPLRPGGRPEGPRSLARVVLSSLDLTGPRVCHRPCWRCQWGPFLGLVSPAAALPGPHSHPCSWALLPRGGVQDDPKIMV